MPANVKLDRVILRHPVGSSAEIMFFGATVTSWKSVGLSDNEPIERLFVSSKAALDGSKPIRGGIPVVFPCFGAPTHPDHMKLPQHGYLRNNKWHFDSIVMDNEAGVTLKLTLAPTPEMKEQFDYPIRLEFVVTLAAHQLSTDLRVRNVAQDLDRSPLEFQALFHNYIRSNSSTVHVTPLTGLSFYDKTEATEEARATPKVEERETVDVRKFTDSVYENAPGKYTVAWKTGEIEIRTVNLKDVVVWNPQAEAGSKIGDMEDGGWERYICVEPGYVRGFVSLKPGETWTGQQVLSVKV